MKRLGLGIKYFSGCLSLGYLGEEPRESGKWEGRTLIGGE